MNFSQIKITFSRIYFETQRTRLFDQSAKLAYFFLLSIFPLLIFLIMLLGMVLKSESHLQIAIHSYLSTLLPLSASDLIRDTLMEVMSTSSSFKLSLLMIFTWWSASQAMLAIMEGLNIAYNIKDTRSWWIKYLLASGLNIAGLVLNTITILLLIYGHRLVYWPILLILVLLVFYLIYRTGPNIHKDELGQLLPGTIVGVSLWLLVSMGFKLYLNYFNYYSVAYGSIGAVIILMMWFYFSGASIIFGAIINAVFNQSVRANTHQ